MGSRHADDTNGFGNHHRWTHGPEHPDVRHDRGRHDDWSGGVSADRGVPTVTQSVVAVNGTVARRITTGSCAGGGSAIGVSTDGGKTWIDHASPFATLVGVQPRDGTTAFAVGADRNCSMGIRETRDGGVTGGVRTGVEQAWARDAADATKVLVPGNNTQTPCAGQVVINLIRVSARVAQAMCSDGALVQTDNEGYFVGQGRPARRPRGVRRSCGAGHRDRIRRWSVRGV